MENERARPYGIAVCFAIVVVVVVATPFVLIILTFVEEMLFGTCYTSELYEDLGIIKPLQAIYRWMSGR